MMLTKKSGKYLLKINFDIFLLKNSELSQQTALSSITKYYPSFVKKTFISMFEVALYRFSQKLIESLLDPRFLEQSKKQKDTKRPSYWILSPLFWCLISSCRLFCCECQFAKHAKLTWPAREKTTYDSATNPTSRKPEAPKSQADLIKNRPRFDRHPIVGYHRYCFWHQDRWCHRYQHNDCPKWTSKRLCDLRRKRWIEREAPHESKHRCDSLSTHKQQRELSDHWSWRHSYSPRCDRQTRGGSIFTSNLYRFCLWRTWHGKAYS